MTNYFTEIMLRQYFTIDVLAGKFIEDKDRLFKTLCKIYLVDDKDGNLLSIVRGEETSSIVSLMDYNRYQRIKQYLSNGVDANDLQSFIINIKGEQLEKFTDPKKACDKDHTVTDVCEKLTALSDLGIIPVINAVGILKSEGLVFKKDVASGLKALKKSASWNNEAGLFAALYYDSEKAVYLSALKRKLKKYCHPEDYDKISKAYNIETQEPEREFFLLEKAFLRGILKKEMYDRSYARMIYSNIVDNKEKEVLLLTGEKSSISEMALLPLKLTDYNIPFSKEALNKFSSSRKEELTKITKCLLNSDLRKRPNFRPLMVSSDSDFLLEEYADAIAEGFNGAAISKFEASDLTDYDLEPSYKNLFVKSITEDRLNLYFFFLRGEITERTKEAIVNFIITAKRQKFHLARPSVTLDLSTVLLILFVDKENANYFRQYCDMVPLTPVSQAEKNTVFDKIFNDKKSLYGVNVTVSEDVKEKIMEKSPDEMAKVLDLAVRENREDGFVFTEEIMKPYLGGKKVPYRIYGFGGSISNENHK